MERRKIAEKLPPVHRLALGTMTFGKQVDERTAASMIDLCLERGINFIDTANMYVDGVSEEIVGRLLAGRRDKVVLATKVGNKMGDGPDDAGLSRGAILKQIDASLRRLQMDYVDLYYQHLPDRGTSLDETVAAMDEIMRQGKARAVGASNYSAWQTCRMRWLAEANGLAPVEVTQPMYNLLARGIEPEFLPMCGALGLATVIYNPLAGGLLTGKHSAEQPPASGTRFDGNAMYQNRYWHRQNFEAVAHLKAAADREGRSLISVSLSWLLHHTPIDCVILGASSREQLQANLDASEDGPCSQELLTACEEAWEMVRPISPRYLRD
jgi:aryl-alcohol dehydrogenase-like predicted oxidoreductase